MFAIRTQREYTVQEDFMQAARKMKEAKNTLEQYCYQVRQTLGEEKLKDKFSEEEKKNIEAKVDEILKWVNDK